MKSQCLISRSEVGGDAKILEGAEAFGHALCELKYPVDGFDGGICELGFHVGKNAIHMFLDGSSELFEGIQPTMGGSGEPPLDGSGVVFDKHVLQGLAQSHGAAKFGVGFAEPMQHVRLLLCARPRVSTS